MPRDDRNKPCRAFTPPLALNFIVDVMRTHKRDTTMPHAEYQDAIAAAMYPRRKLPNLITWAAAILLIIAIPFIAVPASQIVYSHFPQLPPWAGFVAMALIAIPALILVIRLGPRLHWKHWKPAALLRGYCPACGHDLHGLPRESDGCTICTECGAAWRC